MNPVLFATALATVQVADHPLAPNALTVTGSSRYEALQRVVETWEKQGITNYLILSQTNQGEQIVPFTPGYRFFKQLRVLWNVSFGAWPISEATKEETKEQFFSTVNQVDAVREKVLGNDAFCDPRVVKRQLVYEGKEIYVLYNYAPVESLHFLLIPKAHRARFSDLTESEYNEVSELTEKLKSFYKDHYFYVFNKTGPEAGQTVPHWHEHVIFTANKTQDVLGKLRVFKNMLIGSSPLKPHDLKERVETLRNDLSSLKN